MKKNDWENGLMMWIYNKKKMAKKKMSNDVDL